MVLISRLIRYISRLRHKTSRLHSRLCRYRGRNKEGALYNSRLCIPVLNIGRFGWDIVQYFLFCLLLIRYGKIVCHIVCSKKWLIFKILADKSPDISTDMKSYLLHDCVSMYIIFYCLCLHITSFLLGRWYLW